MTDDKDRRLGADDSDELWDDDLAIAAGSGSGDDPVLAEAAVSGPAVDSHGSLASYPDDGYDDDSEYGADDDSDTGYDDAQVSAHQPVAPNKSLRESLFRLKVRRDDDSDDFYDSDAEDEPEPGPKPKPVKLDPEDPDYWMDEESDFERIIPKPRKIWKWWLAGILAALALIVWLWIWFFHPYVDGAVKYGYIKSMERRGNVVKTFEGVLIPYRELGDTTPTYFEPVAFSVDGDSLAARMKGMMLECIPVRLEYEVYHTSLPWKGAESIVVTKADTADVSKILPPEYRWKNED